MSMVWLVWWNPICLGWSGSQVQVQSLVVQRRSRSSFGKRASLQCSSDDGRFLECHVGNIWETCGKYHDIYIYVGYMWDRGYGGNFQREKNGKNPGEFFVVRLVDSFFDGRRDRLLQEHPMPWFHRQIHCFKCCRRAWIVESLTFWLPSCS